MGVGGGLITALCPYNFWVLDNLRDDAILAAIKRRYTMINIYELFEPTWITKDCFSTKLDPNHLPALREFIVLESERCYWEAQSQLRADDSDLQRQLVNITVECMAVRLDVLDNSSPAVRDTACAILLEINR